MNCNNFLLIELEIKNILLKIKDYNRLNHNLKINSNEKLLKKILTNNSLFYSNIDDILLKIIKLESENDEFIFIAILNLFNKIFLGLNFLRNNK